MADRLRIGIIGLDTSHVTAFTGLLNDPANPNHVPGGKVVVAFPGGSKDFGLSINRIEGFTKELKEKWGVEMVDSPEACAEACDLLLIESVDGRVHLDQFRRTIKFKRPTYIDKPFTVKYAEALEIARLAKEAGVPVMSTSGLRYDELLVKATAPGAAPILGVDTFGPMNIEPTQPGLFWYGIHQAEMIVAALGTGCVEAKATTTENQDLVSFKWADGRMASLRGLRQAHSKFGLTIHTKAGYEFHEPGSGRPLYALLVEAIMQSLPHGRSAIPIEQTLEIVKILEAANKSRETGQAVKL